MNDAVAPVVYGAVRLTDNALLRVFNSARNEQEILAALRRVQESVLAANHLLPADEITRLRKMIDEGLHG